jgi:3-methyladenine DNA glycosylase AlkD
MQSVMTAEDILTEIKPLGTEGYCRVMKNHGAHDPIYGVKIGDLQKIVKREKVNYQLAKDLYDTGVYDAMYLAGLIADDAKMTEGDLQRWAEKASRPLATSTVPWVAAGSPHGWQIALKWIESENDLIATAGWATLSCLVSIFADDKLDLVKLGELLYSMPGEINSAPDMVRIQMNSFVISVGSYVIPLHEKAISVGHEIGNVSADVGKTACKIPSAVEYIAKVQSRGTVGKKRKTVKC